MRLTGSGRGNSLKSVLVNHILKNLLFAPVIGMNIRSFPWLYRVAARRKLYFDYPAEVSRQYISYVPYFYNSYSCNRYEKRGVGIGRLFIFSKIIIMSIKWSMANNKLLTISVLFAAFLSLTSCKNNRTGL